jgi:hypothetical protein
MKAFAMLLCTLIIFFGTTNVFALEIVPTPVEIDLGDGLVFWKVLPEDEATDFPRSGLYQDGELLYPVDVDINWWWGLLYFSDDGMTFFRVPSSGGSIFFYKKGVVMHEYDVLSLLKGGEGALLQPPAGSIETTPSWDFAEKRHYDRENNILRFTTVENVIITFDLSSGALLSDEEPAQNNYIIVLICCAGAVVFFVVLLQAIKRKRSK